MHIDPEGSKHTLQQAIHKFLASLNHHAAPQTIIVYKQALTLFTTFLGKILGIRASKVPISDTRIEWAQAFFKHLQDANSIETEHLYSRAVLKFYRTIEGIQGTPNTIQLETYLKEHRRPKQHSHPAPPISAINKIISHIKATPTPPITANNLREGLRHRRDKAFILTLAETGLRASEICNLRCFQFEAKLNTLHTGESQTAFPLTGTTTRAICRYLEARAPLDSMQLLEPQYLPLFARHDKRAGEKVLPLSRWTVANIVKHWTNSALSPETRHELSKNNQQITPHTFRHYFVIKTIMQTRDLELAQGLARHADTSTTKRYWQALFGEEQTSNAPLQKNKQ